MDWLNEKAYLIVICQILLDLGLIVLLAVFLVKRSKALKGAEELTSSLEKVIEETKTIAEQFDANLNERQSVMQQIIARLDQQIQEGQKTCRQLGSVQNEIKIPSPQPSASHHAGHAHSMPSPRNSEQQEIFRLAQKGHSAEAIAKRLQKPVGEVELILNLRRLSSEP